MVLGLDKLYIFKATTHTLHFVSEPEFSTVLGTVRAYLTGQDPCQSCCCHPSLAQRTRVNSLHLNAHCLELGPMPVSPEGRITDDAPSEEESQSLSLRQEVF